jgi:uncharacterized protein (DUF983 family)
MAAEDPMGRPATATAMWRGFRAHCPHCGRGALFKSLLKLSDHCAACGEALGDIRADDLPAYLTVLVVGHVVVPGLLWAERYDFSTVSELAVALPLSLALIAVLLPRFKGAAAGLIWALNQQKSAAT